MNPPSSCHAPNALRPKISLRRPHCVAPPHPAPSSAALDSAASLYQRSPQPPAYVHPAGSKYSTPAPNATSDYPPVPQGSNGHHASAHAPNVRQWKPIPTRPRLSRQVRSQHFHPDLDSRREEKFPCTSSAPPSPSGFARSPENVASRSPLRPRTP